MSGPSPVVSHETSHPPNSSPSHLGVPSDPFSPKQGQAPGNASGQGPNPIPQKSGITELFGTILIVVGILVFLALLSFQMDLSEGSAPSPGTNLIGTVGHYSARMLFYLFGKSAFLAGPWLFLLGGLTIYRGGFSDPVSRLLALLTVMLGSSLLGGILWGSDGTPSEGAGGLIGLYLGGSLQTLFGFYGALILAFGVFAAGVFLSIRLPMPVVWAAMGDALGRQLAGLNRIFTENRYRPDRKNASPLPSPKPESFSEDEFSREADNLLDPDEQWNPSGDASKDMENKSNKNTEFHTGFPENKESNKESMIQKVRKDPKEVPPWFQKITIGDGDGNREEMPAEEEGFREPFGDEALSEPSPQQAQKDGREFFADRRPSDEALFGEGSFGGFRSFDGSGPDALEQEDSTEAEDEFFYEGYFADSEDRFFFRRKDRGLPGRFFEDPDRFDDKAGVPRAPKAPPSYFRDASEMRKKADGASARFQAKRKVLAEKGDGKTPLLRPFPENPIKEDGPAFGALPDSREVLYRYRRRLDGHGPAPKEESPFTDGNPAPIPKEEAIESKPNPMPSFSRPNLPKNEHFPEAAISGEGHVLQHNGEIQFQTEAFESTQADEPSLEDLALGDLSSEDLAPRQEETSQQHAASKQEEWHEAWQQKSASEKPTAKESAESPENPNSENVSVEEPGLPKPPVSVRDILHEAVGTGSAELMEAATGTSMESSLPVQKLAEPPKAPNATEKVEASPGSEMDLEGDGTQEDLPPVSVRDGANRVLAEPRKRKPEKSLVPELSLEKENYFIPTDILRPARRLSSQQIEEDIELTKLRLEQVFADYRIPARVVRTQRGPIITLYEIKLEPGTKVARISGIHDEIKMHLEAQSIRIIAPIPGRPTIGIEIPNRKRQPISLREMLAERPPKGEGLSIVLGANIKGKKIFGDLTKLPHLLIAGATGSGKSVYMNSVIASLLCSYSPENLRFIMIDPKMVELRLFEGIPHLLMPVITDVRKANKALTWAVMEMERRYAILSALKSRDIRSYNERIASRQTDRDGGANKMPYIVILIDELADLMMVAAKDVEDSIIRLTQKARAVGIHLIMATQRPSVDVITALIKANCPARIAFQVSQKTDSRTILDANGAENLLGKGDMLYRSPVSTSLERLQAPFISEEEIEELVSESRRFGEPVYVDLGEDDSEFASDEADGEAESDLLDEAWRIIKESGKTSTSYVQRRLRIGYNRAANLIEELEERGYLGPAIGNKPREILKRD